MSKKSKKNTSRGSIALSEPRAKNVLFMLCTSVPDAEPLEESKAGVYIYPQHELKQIKDDMTPVAATAAEFSINPAPLKVRLLSDLEITQKIEKTIKRELRNMIKHHIDYYDLSSYKLEHDIIIFAMYEHSSSGKYHFHGIIRGLPNDFVNHFKNTMTRNIGRTRIHMISNVPKYMDYMFKSYVPTKEFPTTAETCQGHDVLGIILQSAEFFPLYVKPTFMCLHDYLHSNA